VAHGSIAPVVALALFFTSKFQSWKTDLVALITLGIVRGIAINVGFEILGIEPQVSALYKVFNSAISLPLWFIGIAVFVESRRQFQKEFEALFLRSVRREQTSEDMQNLNPVADDGELIQHLQAVASGLAYEIEGVLSQPASQVDYAKQTSKIQDLINSELRPASAKLWNGSTLTAPKLSIPTLVRISLLDQKLKVFTASLLFAPYIFIGLNGTLGWRFAAIETFLATSLNILVFLVCEALFKNGLLNRRFTNVATMGLSYVIPLQIIEGSEVLSISSDDLNAVRDIDLARYLHGELQAGLIATSLLLQRASKTGDTDLARHALRSAANILRQDHARISQSRISSPQARLEKISTGWRGIAEVRIDLDWIDHLETSVQNDVIALIDEGVSNAIRHAKASVISVSGTRDEGVVHLEIRSDGSGMTEQTPGLGTKLFNELTSSYAYSRQGDKNLLTFTVRSTPY